MSAHISATADNVKAGGPTSRRKKASQIEYAKLYKKAAKGRGRGLTADHDHEMHNGVGVLQRQRVRVVLQEVEPRRETRILERKRPRPKGESAGGGRVAAHNEMGPL